MPTIAENAHAWSQYEWPEGGDEWSTSFGGSGAVWWGILYPRLYPYLPASSILEIAPGFGRITQFLKDQCQYLTIVDLVPRCIEACRERFRESTHVTYHVNDGQSLDMIPTHSQDFVFSFDSLVHAEMDVLEAYLNQLRRILKATGVAFLHHSNLGDHLGSDGQPLCPNPHWRATTVSADSVVTAAHDAGLHCIAQETINWGGGPLQMDCFSLFTRAGKTTAPPRRLETRNFGTEVALLAQRTRHYAAP